MKVEASGTCTLENAGFGLFTVRAQSHAITLSLSPICGFKSGRPFTISAVISTLG